jgi:replicative DNA helicase
MTTAVGERVLPHSLEAERSVLGAILIDNDVYDTAAAVLEPQHFFRDAHRRIFVHLRTLGEQSRAMDLVTLHEELDRAGELDAVGGALYLSTLIDGVPHATNIEHYARIVKEKATLRSLIFSANKILADAYEADEDADVLLDRAESSVMAIGRQRSSRDFILADEWMAELHTVIQEAIEAPRMVTGVATGLPSLDRLTRGFQKADLIYIGGRPGDGKTSIMLQIASRAADEIMAGIESLEMQRREIGRRLIAMEAQVDLHDLMTGYLDDAQQRAVGEAMNRITQKHLAIDDASGITAMQLRSKIRRLASRHGLGIVFVDYLQLIQSAGENRALELGAISGALKALAKDLDIPVVVLSQLSREHVKANRPPTMADLRDSGVEADADLILLLHRPKASETTQRYQDGEEAELLIAKQRNGPTGKVKLQWNGAQTRFTEVRLDNPTLPLEASAS